MRNFILIAPADVIKSVVMGMWSHQSVLIDARRTCKSSSLSLSGGVGSSPLSQLTSNVTISWKDWTREPIDSKEKSDPIFSRSMEWLVPLLSLWGSKVFQIGPPAGAHFVFTIVTKSEDLPEPTHLGCHWEGWMVWRIHFQIMCEF